jgi:hypothetical protein
MGPRSLLGWALSEALILAPAVAGADVAPDADERDVPEEAVFTGLRDFPAYRFVVAVSNASSFKEADLPPPTPVEEGVVVPTSKMYFQHLRAIPTDAPDPVTYGWLASTRTPGSGLVMRRALRVRKTSTERVTRLHFQLRQIQAGFVSLELLSAVALLLDGSERPFLRLIPHTAEVTSLEAPQGFRLFLMPDPAWPRADPSPPVVPCTVGEVLPSSPGPRTLVAVEGAPGPDGSLAGKTYVAWTGLFDPWRRDELFPGSPAVARREELHVRVVPGSPVSLEVAHGERFQDAQGRWFVDEALTLPADVPVRWGWWVAGGAAAGALGVGAWARVQRRRARGAARA